MAATKFSFYVISTSDRGDFPRIIVIALFFIYFLIFGILMLSWCEHYTVVTTEQSNHLLHEKIQLDINNYAKINTHTVDIHNYTNINTHTVRHTQLHTYKHPYSQPHTIRHPCTPSSSACADQTFNHRCKPRRWSAARDVRNWQPFESDLPQIIGEFVR